MAKKELQLPYTDEQLLERLDHPLWQVYDRRAKLYRYFGDKADYEAALALLNDGQSLTAELLLKEHHNLTAPAPYVCSIKNYIDGVAILDGTTGTYLEFDFQTVDGNGVMLNESVDVTFTFTNNGVSQQAAATYAGGEHAKFLVDEFLKSGINTITIIATGRTSMVASTPVVLTYNVVSVGIRSTFDCARSQDIGADGLVNILATFNTWASYDKYVEFYVDSQIVDKATVFISAANDMTEDTSVAHNADLALPLAPGVHTLQMRTRLSVSGRDFYSTTLYYGFVVTGKEQTCVTIAVELPAGTLVTAESPLILRAEQYKSFTTEWGYYTSKVSGHTATVTWRLAGKDGDDITISTQDATMVDVTNNVKPDPIVFVPEIFGEYSLEAVVGGVVVSAYPIQIAKNTDGIEEYSNGLRMKLSAMGRSNSEPSALRSIWTDRGFTTTFSGLQWNSVSGWLGNALVLKDGATADVNIRSFLSPQDTGATVEVTFETFAVADEDAPVLFTGLGADGGSLAIYGKKAVMRSRYGATVATEFQTGQKIAMAFVINASSVSGITSEPNLMRIQTNGIQERHEDYDGTSDTFNCTDMLHLGDAQGRAAIRVYTIRIYDRAIGRNEEANNYILGTNSITQLLSRNDILTNGIIDVDKLTDKYDTIAITAPINKFFNSTSKDKLYGNVWRKNPGDPRDNFEAVGAEISHPGQSTLGFSKPQLRINMNEKKSCVLYDWEGNMQKKGFYPISYGAIAEKKVRLNPNFVDSTCANAGGFFSMVNDIYPQTQVGNAFVLRNAAQEYAATEYPKVMGQPFPYEIQSCPRAVPVVVIWRPDEKADWSFLSVFTLLDEKKSPRKFGQKSIYPKVLPNGKPDPFDMEDGLSGERLWDNGECYQYEIQDNGEALALFRDMTHFWTDEGLVNEQVFERECCKGKDSDDCTNEELDEGDTKFFRLAKFIYDCRNDQAKFDAEWKQYLKPHLTAAYYILLMKLGMVDSSVRNMDLRSDDGTLWYPIWWDPDVQKGKRNDGPLVYAPRIDRQSKDPNNDANYAFAGHDSAFWDLLEGCKEFMQTIVPETNTAMYNVGFTAQGMMEYYRRFTNYYCIRLYNESIQEKYVNEFPASDYLAFNMGNGEQHDLWWVADSFQYWDARWVSGAYAKKSIYIRANGAYGKYSDKATDGRGNRMYFKSAKEQYYMWAQTNIEYRQIDEPLHVQQGETFHFELGEDPGKLQDFGYNNPFVMFGSQALEEADFHEIAPYMSSEIQLYGFYDEDLGTNVKRLVLGVSKEDMAKGVFNTEQISFGGLDKLDILEYLDVQGQRGLQSFAVGSFDQLTAVKTLLAAGSGLTSLSPAKGLDFTLLELPDTLRSLQMTDSAWRTLTFYHADGITPYESVPATLEAIYFYNMGTDERIKEFVFAWLRAIDAEGGNFETRHLTLSNLVWDNVSVDDMLLLARIPEAQRRLSGTITINSILTAEEYSTLVEAFGENVFTHGAALVINAQSAFVIGGVTTLRAGHEAQIRGVSFPISDYQPRVMYEIIGASETYDDEMRRVYMMRNVILYAETGVIRALESADLAHQITIRGIDQDTFANSSMTIDIVPRDYPTAVAVQGETQVLEPSIYDYKPQFTPTGTDGTQTDFEWQVSQAQGVSIYSQTKDKLRLRVADTPAEEVEVLIDYMARFANGRELTAEQMRVLVMTVQTILRQVDKPHLMQRLYEAGLCASPYLMTNVEARTPLRLPATMTGDTELEAFPEIRFFKSLVEIDLRGCTGMGDEQIDLSPLTRCNGATFEESYVSVKF